jgi:hypothetical protein
MFFALGIDTSRSSLYMVPQTVVHDETQYKQNIKYNNNKTQKSDTNYDLILVDRMR